MTPDWYKDAIIYELHVKAFNDSNADGVGDFPGLMQRLDYLQSLGVTCIWLLPFFPSPLRDDGYDIADYMDVHPSYGTMDDFRSFLAAAHERVRGDLRVLDRIVDALEPDALAGGGAGDRVGHVGAVAHGHGGAV